MVCVGPSVLRQGLRTIVVFDNVLISSIAQFIAILDLTGISISISPTRKSNVDLLLGGDVHGAEVQQPAVFALLDGGVIDSITFLGTLHE